MCGVKLIDKRNSQNLVNALALEKVVDRLLKAKGVQLYGSEEDQR